MNASELLRSVKAGKCPSLLYLYGEEDFLLEQCLSRLKDQIVPPEARDFNLTTLSARDARPSAVLETVRTYPVFSPRRLVLVYDAQHYNASDLEQFADYLKDPVPDSVLVCIADKVDGRRKFFQQLKKKGALFEFKPLYDNKIPGFVQEQLRLNGYEMTEAGLKLFCRRIGSNLREIHAELEKLYTFAGERKLLDEGEVRAVVSDTRSDTVFALLEAIGNGERSDALRQLNRLLDEGTAPLMILTMVVRHFRQLWKACALMSEGVSRKEMPRALGVNPYFLDGILRQAKRIGVSRCRSAFELFVEADLALKSSGANPRALMEQLVLKILPSGR